MTPKEKLEEYGFKKVGFWHKTNSNKTKINHHLDENAKNQEDLNYAFVDGDLVFYIGVTTKTLSKRMDGYKHGKESEKDKNGKTEASTNKKIYKRILERLEMGEDIFIYALQEICFDDYKGLKVSSVSGIEHSLIREFDNGELLNKRAIHSKIEKPKKSNFISKDGKEFEMTLGNFYYKSGKIGFRKMSSHLLPDETSILMYIHIKNEKTITGTFTRSGPTLSINGKTELIKWYSDNFKLDEKILVKILDSKNVELSQVQKNNI